MPAGIQILNPSTGMITIDENYSNYMLCAKGTSSTSSPPSNSGNSVYQGSVIYITGAFYMPVVAVNSTAITCNYTLLDMGFMSLGNTTVSTLTIWSEGSVGTTVDWWVFDIARNGVAVDASTAKLEVYDYTGLTVFSSLYRSMSVVDAFQITYGAISPASHTYTSGRVYANASFDYFNGFSVTGAGGGTGNYWREIGGGSWSGTTFTPSPCTTSGYKQGGTTSQAPTGKSNLIILDVTNF